MFNINVTSTEAKIIICMFMVSNLTKKKFLSNHKFHWVSSRSFDTGIKSLIKKGYVQWKRVWFSSAWCFWTSYHYIYNLSYNYIQYIKDNNIMLSPNLVEINLDWDTPISIDQPRDKVEYNPETKQWYRNGNKLWTAKEYTHFIKDKQWIVKGEQIRINGITNPEDRALIHETANMLKNKTNTLGTTVSTIEDILSNLQ